MCVSDKLGCDLGLVNGISLTGLRRVIGAHRWEMLGFVKHGVVVLNGKSGSRAAALHTRAAFSFYRDDGVIFSASCHTSIARGGRVW